MENKRNVKKMFRYYQAKYKRLSDSQLWELVRQYYADVVREGSYAY